MERDVEKESLSMNETTHASFETLKEALLSPPVSRIPSFDEELINGWHVLGTSLGAMLMQNGHLVAFSSQELKGDIFSCQPMKRKC